MPRPGPPSDESWRLLSHPMRSRIVAHLRVSGSSSASALARALGTTSGVTSYHLRALERAGLVTDTGTGDGRTRVWAMSEDEAVTDDLTVTQLDPEEAADDLYLDHDLVDHAAQRAHAWVDGAAGWPQVWQEGCGLTDHLVLVDDEQLVALTAELEAVLSRYRRIGAGTPGARRVAAYTLLTPLDPLTRVRPVKP